MVHTKELLSNSEIADILDKQVGERFQARAAFPEAFKSYLTGPRLPHLSRPSQLPCDASSHGCWKGEVI